MKRKTWKKAAALGLGVLLAVETPWTALNGWNPAAVAQAYTERSATVKATSLNIRSDAGTNYSVVARLNYGTAVTVIGEKQASDGVLWYQVRFSGSGGNQQTGYASSQYIKFPVSYSADADFEAYLDAQGFPESYRAGLRELHAQYPSWVFTAQHTGLDWETVIENESVITRNLVASSSISSWKSIEDGAYNWDTSSWNGFDGSSWVQASEDIIRYYMDPRNFLNEKYIFQFLLQSYNSSTHSAEGLESMVKGTFLESTASGNVSDGTGETDGQTGPGADSGSSDSSASSGGPGVSGSGQTGASSEGPGAGSVTVVPETSGSQSTGTLQEGEVIMEGPGSSDTGTSDVSLIGPQASVSEKERQLLTEVGPGVSLSGPSSGNTIYAGSETGPTSSDTSSSDSQSGTSSGTSPSSGSRSYVDIILDAGVQSGVNPYVLAAMIIQEQGSAGTSPMISGTVSGYEGIYNFFNVEAYETSTMSKVAKGLSYAAQSGSYNRPWNSVEKSIIGGAINYGENYVKAGQDTFYLKKFNVQGSNMYKHQYMTNVQGAASEGAKMAEAYGDALKDTALEFKIPVYNNMPAEASAMPTADGSPNNKLSSLSVSGFTLTPVFDKDTVSYDLIVNASVTSVDIQTSALESHAQISGSGTVNLTGSNTDAKVTVTAQNGTVREYVIHIVQTADGPVAQTSGNSGQTSGTDSSSGGPSVITVGPGESSGTDTSSGTSGPGVSTVSPGDTSGPGGSDVTVIN